MRSPFLLLAISLCSLCSAQNWCVPGSIWVYHDDGWGWDFRKGYEYVGDTVIDGIDTHKTLVTVHAISQGQTQVSTSWEYSAEVGDVVLLLNASSAANADTLYWFGEIGDRWWPIGADTTCPPFGMLQIMDTAHVTLTDVTLRTWEVAYLDQDGDPYMGSFQLIERIGAIPRVPFVFLCGGVIDYFFPHFVCYRDDEITTPAGVDCALTLSFPHLEHGTTGVLPNPGTDQLSITGLITGSAVEVRDPLGRLVYSLTNIATIVPIETSTWEPGTYFVSINTSDGKKQTLRWIKQ